MITDAMSAAFEVGSTGGNGGNADTEGCYPSYGGSTGLVTVTNLGGISTTGDGSSAITLQSVDGAGGNAGHAALLTAPGGRGGNSGRVQRHNTGTISTRGDYSFDVMDQSVSGAGGTGIFVSGANGGDTGLAGPVSVTQDGTIETRGKGSTAILAQSVGGAHALDAFQATAPTIYGGGGKSSIFFRNSGGSVLVTNTKSISTLGDEAQGVLAPSFLDGFRGDIHVLSHSGWASPGAFSRAVSYGDQPAGLGHASGTGIHAGCGAEPFAGVRGEI
ncbi:hypothetical protein ABLE91_04130 [Aquabacter sp. CN5-332]|uniref:hypothetical protein n=1 Tax=Aquabacter sp. CN5-332 TaxID=3156608 RepID=UPI0032B36800